jgi:hypothetical protein
VHGDIRSPIVGRLNCRTDLRFGVNSQRLDRGCVRRVCLHEFLSGFIEYNYYDFGNRDLAFQVPGTTFTEGIKETKSVVKAGPNFRFGGWGGPVRY